MVKNNLKNTTSGKKIDFPIPVSSYKMILIGFGIIILGFILIMIFFVSVGSRWLRLWC